MKYLELTEVKAMLLEVNNERARIGILLGLWHGLRCSEIINVLGKDIKYGRVYVERLKGSEATTQRYQRHPDLILDEAAVLTKLSSYIRDDERVVPMTRDGFLKLFKRVAIRVGIDPLKAHPHTLKHTCAYLTIGAGIENCRQRLGHKSLASTGAYLRVTDDKASDAIDAFLGIEGNR